MPELTYLRAVLVDYLNVLVSFGVVCHVWRRWYGDAYRKVVRAGLTSGKAECTPENVERLYQIMDKASMFPLPFQSPNRGLPMPESEEARSIWVPGTPRPVARPRVVTQEGKTHGYTPDPAGGGEQIQAEWLKAHGRNNPFPKGMPLRVNIAFNLGQDSPGMSLQVEPAELGPLTWWAKRPDLENLMRAWDALNGIAWHDDAQIVQIVALKHGNQ